MRVGTNDLRMDQRRPFPRPHVRDSVAHRLVAREVIGAVAPVDLKSREVFDDAREVTAWRLHFNRCGDGVAVVFDEVEHRKYTRARGVERFPEFAFAGRSLADGDERDLIALEFRRAIRNGFEPLVQTSSFRDADAMQTLRGNRAACGWNVETRVRPVRGHLTAAGGRIVLGTDRAEQHVERRDAERERERTVTVVGEKPVVARTEMAPGGDENGFVPGAADLEERLALILELYLLVVDLPRQEHEPIGGE